MPARTAALSGAIIRVFSESLVEQSDRQLLDRFEQTGDEAAFTCLVDRHGPMILGLYRRLVDSPDRADDVLQATFLLLARKSRSMRRRESLTSWLAGVARRMARQVRLTDSARCRRESKAANQRAEATAGDPAWDELLRILDEELQLLPERERAPLVLCFLEGRTQDEAAKHLGWSLSTLRRRLETGRQMLRSRMTRRGATLGAALFAGVMAPSACAALTPIMRQSIVGASANGGQAGAVSALASELVKGAMRMTALTKIANGLGLTLLLSGALAGAVWGMGLVRQPDTPPAQKKSDPSTEPAPQKETSADPDVRRDQPNDLLPKGAVARLGSTRFRHGGSPYCAPAFSIDGQKVASASAEGLYVFDVASGRLLRHIRLPDQPYNPRVVRFLGDGKRIAVAAGNWGKSAALTVYNLADGKIAARSEFQSTKSQIFVIDFNADASQILVEDRFAKVFLWDVKTERELWSFEHPEASNTLPFTADGKRFVLARSRTAELRDTSSGKIVAEFPNPGKKFAAFYTAAGLAPDGRLAFTSLGSGVVVVVDAQGKPDVRTFVTGRNSNRSTDHISRLFFSLDSRYVIATGGDSTLVFDLNAKEQRDPVTKLPAAITCGFSSDGKTLALDGLGCISLWRIGDWKLLPQSADPSSAVNRVKFTTDGKQVIGRTQTAWLSWPATGGPAVRVADEAALGSHGAVDISADGRVAADILSEPGEKSILRVIDLKTGNARRFPLDISPWSIRVSPDGRRVMTDDQGEFIVWDAETGKVVHQQKFSGRFLFGAALTPDGKEIARSVTGVFLANARPDPLGQMYSDVFLTDHLANKELKLDPVPWSIYVNGAQFSSDGSKVVLEGRFENKVTQDSVSVWDTRTGRRLLIWQREAGHVVAVALSADGRSLLIGDKVGHLADVELATSQERAGFQHGGEVLAVAFDPTGLRIVASSPEAPIYVWDLLGEPGRWKSENTQLIWTNLASGDPKTGFAAIRLLRANPAEAIAFLRERMQAPAVPAKDVVARLIKQLDSPQFAERENAQKELANMAEMVATELAEAIKGNVTVEVRERLEKVLKSLETMTPDRLRHVRACEVLEGIATPEALKLLRTWTAGPDGSRLTIEARESLERGRSSLPRRGARPPNGE